MLERYDWTLSGTYLRLCKVQVDARPDDPRSVACIRTRVVRFRVPDMREDDALFQALFVKPCDMETFPYMLTVV